MPNKPKLSLWEYISLIRPLCRIVFTLVSSSITGIFRSSSSGIPSYKRHVFYNLVRASSKGMSTRQTQALSPSTLDGYMSFARSVNFQPTLVILDDDDATRGFWMGNEDAENTYLYFHGGGYAIYANHAQFQTVWNMIEKVKSRGGQLSVLILEYDLAPGAVYPRQIQQATLALKYLIHTKGKRLSQIIIGGDSAGGNLALSVVSHLMHPHPKLPMEPIKEKLKGLLLISPWATFCLSARAMQENADKDLLAANVLKQWSDAYLGGAVVDEYNSPLHAAPKWWNDIPASRVLITVGEHEMLRDDSVKLGEKMKECNDASKFEIVVADKEPHDAPTVDGLIGIFDGPSALKVYEWVCEVVTGH